MTWVILFIYSCHLIYWLESFYLLTPVISFIDSSHFIYWLQSCHLLTRVILFIDSSHLFIDSNHLFIDSNHFIYWPESFYYWLESIYWLTPVMLFIDSSHFFLGPLYGFAMDHRRPTTPSILSPEGSFSPYKSPLCEQYLGCIDEAPLEVNYHYHGSVDISTTNAPIEDRTKGRDSLRCNLPLAKQKSAVRAIFGVFWRGATGEAWSKLPLPRFCGYLNNKYSNRESDKRAWFAEV